MIGMEPFGITRTVSMKASLPVDTCLVLLYLWGRDGRSNARTREYIAVR